MKWCIKADNLIFKFSFIVWRLEASCETYFTVHLFVCVCFQWKREQEFDLQLLERAVQGEEAQVVRSVQGEETAPDHRERPRSRSDEWLTLRSTTPSSHEVDLEPLDFDLDLNKEVSYLSLRRNIAIVFGQYFNIVNE